MAFDLYLEMVGLCLFVPDPRTQAVHVLLPATCHGGLPQHVVRLCVDTAYLREGSAAASGVLALVPASRVELALGGTTGIDLALPTELVNVGAVTQRPVSPGALDGDDPEKRLSARVRLTSGACASHEPGVCWSYPDSADRRRLCNRVTWKMRIEEKSLNLAFEPLAGGAAWELPPLYPIVETGMTGTIKMAVYHTTRDELPPNPVEPPEPLTGAPAHHFLALYTLFDPPANGPLPLFAGLNCDGRHVGGSPYTCMGAQTPPVP